MLHKLVTEGNRDLDQLVRVATSVYYNTSKRKEGPGKGNEKLYTAGSSNPSTQRGFPGAKSKPKAMLSM
jgi:hypothetical protein